MERLADCGAVFDELTAAIKAVAREFVLKHHRARRAAYRAYIAAHTHPRYKSLLHTLLAGWWYLANLEPVSRWFGRILARLGGVDPIGFLLVMVARVFEFATAQPPPDTPIKAKTTIPNAPNAR